MEMFGVDGVFSPARPDLLGQGCHRHQHRPHPAGADPGDGAERHRAGLRAQGRPLAQGVDRATIRAWSCRPSSTCRWSRRRRPTTRRSARPRRQVGAVFIRQSMKDTSGATVMDPATQVTSLHGVSMLDAARDPFEFNLCLADPARAQRPQRQRARQRRDRGPRQPARRSRCWPPPTRRATPATRPTRCWPPPPASWARAGSRASRRRLETLLDLFLGKVDDAGDETHCPRWTSSRRLPARHRRRPEGGGPAGGPRGARRQVGVRALPARPGRPRHRRRGPGRDRPDAGLGAAAAQAHQPPHGRQPALAPGPLRQPDRCRRAGRAPRARPVLRRARRRDAAHLDRHRARRPGADRPPARRRPSCCPTRSCSACCSPTGPARSRPRVPRVRSPPTARKHPSGCSSTRPWSAC